ncbi:MAG TPA: homoserine dehydrogenase [Anaerolineae bacterium]|nr:homoserine dehydrogenase [Anaerolineae bacterium]
MRTLRLALVGLGNVGRSFLGLMTSKGQLVADRYNLDLNLVAVADRSGALLKPDGIVPDALRRHKQAGGRVSDSPGSLPGMQAAEMVAQAEADVLLEAAPVDLRTAEPGLSCVRTAIGRGMDVVLADKGPLVLAYSELHRLATAAGVRLRFSATVCGSLPTVNIGRRDLVACEIRRVEGIFNSTTNYILTAMAAGKSYAQALADAQAEGVAEADPRLDVEGWDTANKLVILTNSVLRMPATLADVQPVEGIQHITLEELQRAEAEGYRLKLLATAERADGVYRLAVRPTLLPLTHPLARVDGWQMGIVYHTDIMGVQFAAVDERGPIATAAAMLRDLVNLYA